MPVALTDSQIPAVRHGPSSRAWLGLSAVGSAIPATARSRRKLPARPFWSVSSAPAWSTCRKFCSPAVWAVSSSASTS